MPDLAPSRSLSRSLWVAAALGALAVHATGAALILTSMRSESEVELGAPAIEIGVELAAPHVDQNDLPVGPDAEAAAASAAVVEQKEMVEHSDLPKAVPTETDDPDRVVAPNAMKKPDVDPKMSAVQALPSAESTAALATATPSLPTVPPAPRSIAPALGTGESTRRERATWQKELAAHLDKFKRYPADRMMQRAEVVVGFVLDRLGHVLSRRIVKGSGDASFDAEALDMVQRSDPVPAPPPVVADQGLTFSLPVIFHVKGDEAASDAHKPK
jgi:periplasmic protein TonB